MIDAIASIGARVGVSVGVNGVPPTSIVVIAGQSNAAGRADTDDITPSALQTLLETPFPSVLLKQKLAQSTLDPIVWDSDYATTAVQPRVNPTQNMGPELSMARYLDRANPNQFRLAKFALGGSGLNDNWRQGSAYPGSPIGGPNLFAQFISFMQAAETELNGRIAAIVWVQGETDALDTSDAAAYQANFTQFISDVRVSFPGVPFIFNRLHSANAGTFVSTVRAAQTAVDAAVDGTTMVDCDDLTLTDGQHFSANSYVTLGDKFGLAVLGALGLNSPPFADFSSNVTGLSVTFTDASVDDDGSIVSRFWEFGDATTSTETNPVKTYAANGVYLVTLTVTDNSGGTNQQTASVTAIAPTWDIDATASRGVPSSSSQWNSLITDNALSISAPDSIWLMQEASGNLADSGTGGITLTANASPLYQQTVSGWTRLAVGTADATANQRFRSISTSLPDISTTSILVLGYLAITNNPAAARGVIGVGLASTCEMRAATSGGSSALPRITGGGQTATSPTPMGTTVKPFVLKFDRTGLVQALYSDTEKLLPSFGTGAQTGKLVDFGSTVGAVAANARYLYGAAWYGTNAEMTDAQVKAMLQALGWTVTGY